VRNEDVDWKESRSMSRPCGYAYINGHCGIGVMKSVEKEERKKKMIISREQNTKHTYECANNEYEYGRGGKCVHTFRHTYAGIGEMKM